MIHSQKTHVPGATSPGVSVITLPPAAGATSQSLKRRQRATWGAVLRSLLLLLLVGALLEVTYLALYPLLIETTTAAAAVPSIQQALPGLFPWLPRLYWTTLWPSLPHLLAQVSWLNPVPGSMGVANLLLLLLGLASVLLLVAALAGGRIARMRLSPTGGRLFFWLIFLLTALFGLTMLIAPVMAGSMSQDMLLYGLYGRMVAAHHVNPYVFAPDILHQDLLQNIVKAQRVAPYGPLWVDVSILVTLVAHDSVANIVLGFRLIGLVVHLINTVLLWVILSKLMPERRIFATVLYAWNPLVLLLGVSMMHLELVVILFILLAALFYQRNSMILSWILVLLAALVNVLCLLLLPLFLRLIVRQTRFWSWGKCLLWWLGIVVISALVIVLAYAPYLPGWSILGLLMSVREAFLQGLPVNSLNAALFYLPVAHIPARVMWVVTPHHWAYLALLLVGLVLLFSVWLADTLEVAFFFCSWLLLLLVILQPVYWPWYVMLPLALSCTSWRTSLLAILMMLGALFSFYCSLWHPIWLGQGLGAVGLPFLLWGWTLFFISIWQRTHPRDIPIVSVQGAPPHFSRPPGSARVSRPSRPSRDL